MDYQEFMTCLLAGLKGIYGEDAVITATKVLKNNGQHYNGIQIMIKDVEKTVPVISIDEIYEEYGKGSMKMEDCIEEILRLREGYNCPEDIRQFADSLWNWEDVREKIYPILLSTEDNQELMQKLVSMPMLDLSIAYIIRQKKSEGGGSCVKIKKPMLERYGIDAQELHKTAVENMRKDGYRFQDMEDILKNMLCASGLSEDGLSVEGVEHGKMYVLTNDVKLYGAAGILDKKLIREFADGRSFFILPSSIHETIFVPAYEGHDRRELDQMVAEINGATVAEEERLSDHCYYYDADKDEIRMEL